MTDEYDQLYDQFEVNFVTWVVGIAVGYMLGAWTCYLIYVA